MGCGQRSSGLSHSRPDVGKEPGCHGLRHSRAAAASVSESGAGGAGCSRSRGVTGRRESVPRGKRGGGRRGSRVERRITRRGSDRSARRALLPPCVSVSERLSVTSHTLVPLHLCGCCAAAAASVVDDDEAGRHSRCSFRSCGRRHPVTQCFQSTCCSATPSAPSAGSPQPASLLQRDTWSRGWRRGSAPSASSRPSH